jgi:UDP-glucose 4-epimerase
MRSALVTGASGFIGRPFIRLLQSQGWRVIAAGRPQSAASTGVADVLRVDLMEDSPIVLPPEIDTVFHLAGKAHALAEVAQDEEIYFRVNTAGTRRLLEAAQRAGVRAFVYFSSVKAVGEAPAASQPIDESWDVRPETVYGRSKRDAEDLVLRGGYVSHPVVVRPSLVYGPGANGNLEKMIEAIKAGRFPPVPEMGNRRSMVHVDDVGRAAIAVALDPAAAGRTYILTDGVAVSTRQMFDWICGLVGRRVPSWTVPLWLFRLLARIGDVIGKIRRRRFVFDSDALAKLTGSACYSSARIERELAWKPQRALQDSLAEIVRAAGSPRA